MREQHAEGDLSASAISAARGYFRQDCRQRRIKIEKAPLIKQHCHGDRCNCLGEGSNVKNGVCCYRRRALVIGELPETAQRLQFTLETHSQGCARKGLV